MAKASSNAHSKWRFQDKIKAETKGNLSERERERKKRVAQRQEETMRSL
jgi:hypothetical protein